MRRCSIFLIVVGFFASAAYGETVGPGEALTLARAIEIGLKNHPNIAAGASTVRANEARIGQARANYYPQINLTEQYSRIGPVSSGSTTVVSSGGTGQSGTASSSANPFDQYTSSAGLSQMVFDFGKTSNQVSIQSLNTDSARSDLSNTMDLVVLTIKQAYYDLLQAEQNRDLAMDIVKQFQDHLRQAQGFYESGRSPKFDVTKAAVDLGNAQLNLIKAENQVRLVRVTLNNAMGVLNAPTYTLKDTLVLMKFDLAFENALDRAYLQRSDLRSIIARREAAKVSISLAQKGYLPTFSGSANYFYTGTGFPLNNGWNMGMNMTFPFFSGFNTTYQVAEARSNVDVLSAQERSLKQDILLQVQQGYLNLRQADESIATAELLVKQAEENLGLAIGRYRAGVGNPIEVSDSVAALSTARQSYTAALHDYKVATATIEKAIGVR
jgi:outer membrane protein TolC